MHPVPLTLLSAYWPLVPTHPAVLPLTMACDEPVLPLTMALLQFSAQEGLTTELGINH